MVQYGKGQEEQGGIILFMKILLILEKHLPKGFHIMTMGLKFVAWSSINMLKSREIGGTELIRN